MKKIILHPTANSHLSISYSNAIQEAKELLIASAYLTKWEPKIKLNTNCDNILFLIGVDFGITRKSACVNVIKWLPKKFHGNFLAVTNSESGFHPKIMAWRNHRNEFYCIIGSSNLTAAAFETNYEANIEVRITKDQFIEIKNWLESIAVDCELIDLNWVKGYQEAPRITGKVRSKRVIDLAIPDSHLYREAILIRRRNEEAFTEIKTPLKKLVYACASGEISNLAFWEGFWALWGNHRSRIQGSGLQFSCKHANWKQACKALTYIITESEKSNILKLDQLVLAEIDKLARLGNPTRGAWFSEMLCHFLPMYYPILNNPVKIYLTQNKWQAQRGLTQGAKYIDLSKKLRSLLQKKDRGPQNMPELDNAIYAWCNSRGLLNKSKYGK